MWRYFCILPDLPWEGRLLASEAQHGRAGSQKMLRMLSIVLQTYCCMLGDICKTEHQLWPAGSTGEVQVSV